MSTTRSLASTEEKEVILKQFREKIADVLQPTHDDRFLLRWLRARNFNLINAEKMLREDVKFRKEYGSDQMTRAKAISKELLKYARFEQLGFDYAGHLVYLLNFGSCDCKGFVRACTLKDGTKYLIGVFEDGLRRLKEHNEKNGLQVETMIYIMDLGGLNVWQLLDKQVMLVVSETMKIFQDHYPEILQNVYIINAPKVFLYIFNILKTFMDPRVISKIKIYTEGADEWIEIFNTIPREIIPAYLQGTRYEPEGDPYCHDILNWYGDVPRSLYVKNSPVMNIKEAGVKEKKVLPGAVFEIEEYVTTTPAIFTWEFQTKDQDIKFGLYFHPTRSLDKKTDTQELIPIGNADCNAMTERGEYICLNSGTYVFTFDNKHSWFTAKHLLYKIEVRSCSETFQ